MNPGCLCPSSTNFPASKGPQTPQGRALRPGSSGACGEGRHRARRGSPNEHALPSVRDVQLSAQLRARRKRSHPGTCSPPQHPQCGHLQGPSHLIGLSSPSNWCAHSGLRRVRPPSSPSWSGSTKTELGSPEARPKSCGPGGLDTVQPGLAGPLTRTSADHMSAISWALAWATIPKHLEVSVFLLLVQVQDCAPAR